jgi:hypothetical protein
MNDSQGHSSADVMGLSLYMPFPSNGMGQNAPNCLTTLLRSENYLNKMGQMEKGKLPGWKWGGSSIQFKGVHKKMQIAPFIKTSKYHPDLLLAL